VGRRGRGGSEKWCSQVSRRWRACVVSPCPSRIDVQD
jgi:hypothetical protein